MKTLFISLLLVVSSLSNKLSQETETITATYDAYEDGIFYFTDTDGYTNEFSHFSKDAKKMYDLTSDEFIGSDFQITYTSETEMDDLDEEITVNTIIALKLLN
ncbi:hypothetical protein ACFQZJ_04835 [Maribacter chungangensis]|uniref:Uncharacterized protein n=1 Tax=Maribacter chungangensis TaxID=1069117 RepID=A0ABW3B0Y2_9FLAO